MKRVIGLLILTIFLACTKENEIYIDVELQPYFDSFKSEAALRGQEIDYLKEGLDGYLRSLSSDGLKGQCLHASDVNSSVVIDLDFWSQSSHYSREFIVYHELGHCILDRRHLDEVDEHGNCISIMNSGSQECRNFYNVDTRELFLDELFSTN